MFGLFYYSLRYVPKTHKIVAKEIALKKKNRLKENGSMNVLGLVNKHSTKDVKNKKPNK